MFRELRKTWQSLFPKKESYVLRLDEIDARLKALEDKHEATIAERNAILETYKKREGWGRHAEN